MRSEAMKISGCTIVLSALGFLVRWLQDMRIAGEEGLPAQAPITWLVILTIVGTAAVLALLVRHLRQFVAPEEPEAALAGHTPVYGAISLLPAVLLAAAGLLRLVHPGEVLWTATHRLCGAATLVGAFGSALIAMNSSDPEQTSKCRTGTVLMLVFAVFWLITGYRDAAGDPIMWRFLVGILGRCAALLAIFYLSGWFFHSPHPQMAVFSCDFAAFLCIMSAIDNSPLAESLTFAAVAVQFLLWGYVPVENWRTRALGEEEQP